MPASHQPNRGFTLLELLIVLVVVVAVLAVAWPRYAARMNKAAFRHAIDELHSSFAEARRSAIEQGEIWVFRFRIDRGEFELAPLDQFVLDADDGLLVGRSDRETAPGTSSNRDLLPAGQPAPGQSAGIRSLSEPVVFRLDDPTAGRTGGESDAAGEPGGFWHTFLVGSGAPPSAASQSGPPVYLFPGGRATPAVFWLVGRDAGYAARVDVRALTGELVIGPLQSTRPEPETASPMAAHSHALPHSH